MNREAETAGYDAMPDHKRAAMTAALDTLAGLAVNYTGPVIFGRTPEGNPVHTASGFIVEGSASAFLFTASHVLAKYENILANDPTAPFQIGGLELNPIERVSYRNKNDDIASIALDGLDIGLAGITTYRPSASVWPPPLPSSIADSVLFCGVPTPLRWYPRPGEVNFGAVAVVTTVTSVHDSRFSLQFHREDWIRGGYEGAPDPGTNLGGVSGGPALLIGRGPLYPIVGLISEYSRSMDVMYVSSLGTVPLRVLDVS